MSETSKHRDKFRPYIKGIGIDLGFGGDSIDTFSALTLDLERPYTRVGEDIQFFKADAQDLSFICDNVFDYVYSSHLIEDFKDTRKVLKEWLRILKVGGYLCLLFPDEKRYRSIEKRENWNRAHVYLDMGLKYMLDVLNSFNSPSQENIRIVESRELFENNDYNCMIVCQKLRNISF